ncbi:hypothetical protein ACOSQ3_032212 [Xanthoceras sorbifolium]
MFLNVFFGGGGGGGGGGVWMLTAIKVLSTTTPHPSLELEATPLLASFTVPPSSIYYFPTICLSSDDVGMKKNTRYASISHFGRKKMLRAKMLKHSLSPEMQRG